MLVHSFPVYMSIEIFSFLFSVMSVHTFPDYRIPKFSFHTDISTNNMKERPVVILHWFAQNNLKNLGKTLKMMWATVILFYILFLFLNSFGFFLSVLFCFALFLFCFCFCLVFLGGSCFQLEFFCYLSQFYFLLLSTACKIEISLFDICHTVCYSTYRLLQHVSSEILQYAFQ